MNTNKAAYWIALGVLALGLNSEYQHGRFVALHQVASRAGSVLCQISMRAERTLAVARILMSREGLPVDNLLASADRAEMVRAQAEMLREQARDEAELFRDTRERVRDEVRAQADVMRVRAEIQRAEIERFRGRIGSQVRLARLADRRVAVDCPNTRSRIAVQVDPMFADAGQDVEVADTD
jgi:hypothetical protein